MVDAQTIGVLVTAASVTVAAIYYIMTLRTQQENMRETMRNRKATLTNNMMQFTTNMERRKIEIELLSMKWSDFDDFYKKYDSTVNPDNYAKRMTTWGYYEMLGIQYRNDLLDVETIYATTGLMTVNMWMRFKPVIEEYRSLDYGRDFYKNWEYLAKEMAKLKTERDPTWKGSRSHVSSEEYDRAFLR